MKRTLIVLMLFLASGSWASTEIYVAPNGNDQGAGTSSHPFATLSRAKDLVREYIQDGLKNNVNVYIREGRYQFYTPLVFTDKDSGTDEFNVTYSAFPGEKPIISGGVLLDGFSEESNTTWVAKTDLGRFSDRTFEQLFVNGRRAMRATEPDDGLFHMSNANETVLKTSTSGSPQCTYDISFTTEELDSLPLDKKSDLDGSIVTLYKKWNSAIKPVVKYDGNNTFTIKGGCISSYRSWWTKGTRFKIEGFRQALDEPGEWFLDDKGYLFYRPFPGERIEDTRFIAPMSDGFIIFKGTAERPVSNIIIKGLTFLYSRHAMPLNGYDVRQASVTVSSAILADHAQNIEILNCRVSHIGENAIWFRKGCKACKVQHSYISDVGAGGIKIGDWRIPEKDDEITSDIMIDNNIIRSGGHIHAPAVGVWVGHSSNNNITHNDISDLRYSGISVGWTWGYKKSHANDNLISYNKVHHLGWDLLSDMGGIYLLGETNGTTVINNVVHDIYSHAYGGWGIYEDEGSSDIVIKNNLVYNTRSSSYHLHYGRNNFVYNNIFAFGEECQLQFSRIEETPSVFFANNIIYYDEGVLFCGKWDEHKYQVVDLNNIVWKSDGKLSTEKKVLGEDPGYKFIDPKFLDIENREFVLEEDSPAFRLGFAEFDYTRAGVYGDEHWIAIAKEAIYPDFIFFDRK